MTGIPLRRPGKQADGFGQSMVDWWREMVDF
jgi:hypothetical protein